jgi:predicted nuclease of predicted toxin-antitoxin system
MKILTDENIPKLTVSVLREQGHDVLDIRGTAQEGLPDQDLWNLATRENRLLITTDKGFAKQRMDRHSGILLIRLRQPNRQKIHKMILDEIRAIPSTEWPGLLVVVKDRMRSLWRARG